ncbi:MAG: peptide deformylase [Bacteroidota bacterium]|nr:peptide deformylase [Bacteroidota bacterium]
MKNIILALIISLFLFGCSGLKQTSTNYFNSASFSTEQSHLIMEADTLSPMRVLTISNKTDSILLRTKCVDVVADPNDVVLQTFIKRLYATVQDSITLGVGIAAPQVGILKNIIWVQRFDKENVPFEVYLNPKIIQFTDRKQDCREGCLSIPDRIDTTKTRSYAILIEYDQLDKSHKIEMVEDFTAVIFQHEIDHLNGILYTDHLYLEIKDTKR